ncbi:MAG: 1-(5-phosphoribosyl)-5-[(5-phosphoribosylamino)methylideneamino]imidazole-4-carboxamide isomerase [Anaerolineae bacterium]|nr:1-(5-phosphoribosyl)-5-[(5-phosphoribosylamino)methylideneamino]imidazole-4-carboxamide isomerase [Anaerolineae bacterium]
MTDKFTIYPAIDLRGGRVVRLMQGDPGRETQYDHDPLAIAQRWRLAGANWLHVVNLDGAFGETGQANQAALKRILTMGLPVQFGGGVRDLASLRQVLDLGVARVVLGTVAVENPALTATALADFGPERIALGIDARDGVVQIRGWQTAAPLMATGLAQSWADQGGRWLIFTDIARDGVGTGVNLAATTTLAHATGLQVIASGGVAGLDDVRRVCQAGLSGVIIGRALYEGHVQLEEALQIVAEIEK